VVLSVAVMFVSLKRGGSTGVAAKAKDQTLSHSLQV
jgi:hypothetical protein